MKVNLLVVKIPFLLTQKFLIDMESLLDSKLKTSSDLTTRRLNDSISANKIEKDSVTSLSIRLVKKQPLCGKTHV